MLSGSVASAPGFSGVLVVAAILGAAPLPLHAAQAAEQAQSASPYRAADPSATTSWEDFVTLEVRETELVLTNISDRPINAWSIKTVVRSSRGHEAYSTYGKDAYRSARFPGREDELLQPGESITIDKGEEPWIHPNHRGPGSGVYYEVGALTFPGGEATGDQEIVNRIFETRLDIARTALKALEVTASADARDAGALKELPGDYHRRLDTYSNRAEGLRAVYGEAWADYTTAVENLRPQDLDQLPSLEEVLP